MSDFLERIVAHKRAEVRAAAAVRPTGMLRDRRTPAERRSLQAALAAPGVRIIAEIKRASPSKGPIRPGLDAAKLAADYAAGGAAALSVLTESAFFQGSVEDLQAAAAATRLPVLRKDFIIDPYQVHESAAIGADAILLIARILDDAALRELAGLAAHLHLECLVEVHDAADAGRAVALGATLVGINNRDLSHFGTDTGKAAALAASFPPHVCVVAASGIASRQDIADAGRAGIRRFLIGESLVRSDDPVSLLRTFTRPL